MKPPIRILAIDGGGIRGILPAVVLANLEKRTGKPVSQLFDLVAGTSTGGLLALGLAKPGTDGRPAFRAQDLVALYEEKGAKIFRPRRFGFLKSFLQERYHASGIEGVLQATFGQLRLSDALCPLLIAAYEIERQVPFFFRSQAARQRSDYDFPMWQVSRATSAAPTYFSPFRMPAGQGADYYALIDGGLFANNPALCALVEAKRMFPDAEEFLVVSLGTGETHSRLSFEDAAHWGVAQWAKPILGMVMQSVSKTVDYQLQTLFSGAAGTRSHYRLQTTLPDHLGAMDKSSPRHIRELRLEGEAMVRRYEAELAEIATKLTA